jgi:hypothetical protein
LVPKGGILVVVVVVGNAKRGYYRVKEIVVLPK